MMHGHHRACLRPASHPPSGRPWSRVAGSAFSSLVHYRLHAEIDSRHASEFYQVVAPQWQQPGRRYFIQQGLELGAYCFDRLYRDLLVQATARA